MVELNSALFIFTLAGIILIIAGNWVIEASKKLVHLFNLSGYTIGFVVLALSTSLPELFVSISAGLQGQSDIIIGNVIGSNVANILLVLGSYAAIAGIKVTKSSKLTDYAQALFFVSIIPLFLLGRGHIGSIAGLVLIGLFMVYTLFLSKKKARAEIKETFMVRQKITGSIVFLISVALLIYSSSLLVSSAVEIAEALNLSSLFISITLIALGTSLPEMAVNISALLKKEYKLAIGNILGSCVINLTLVLGAGAVIYPITVDYVTMGSAMIFLVIVNLVVWILLEKFRQINRMGGLAFIALYILFILAEIGLVPYFL